MLAAIRRGDKVVTGGGIFGTVTKVVSDDEVQVEISDGVRVKIARATLASVVSKTEPVREKAKDKDKKSDKEGEEQKPKAANDTEASDKDEKKEGVSLLKSPYRQGLIGVGRDQQYDQHFNLSAYHRCGDLHSGRALCPTECAAGKYVRRRSRSNAG